jgi:hypothetical protein
MSCSFCSSSDSGMWLSGIVSSAGIGYASGIAIARHLSVSRLTHLVFELNCTLKTLI